MKRGGPPLPAFEVPEWGFSLDRRFQGYYISANLSDVPMFKGKTASQIFPTVTPPRKPTHPVLFPCCLGDLWAAPLLSVGLAQL